MTPITVFGEALVDLVGQGGPLFRAVPGGGPANIAIGLARLGVHATLVTGLGSDAFGRLVTDHVTASGAQLDVQPCAFTGMAVVSLSDEGVPSYDFALSWEPAAPVVRSLETAFVTGSLTAALAAPQTEAAMASFRETATVCYDPNVRPAFSAGREADRERVTRQVSLAHLVKASEEDLAWLYPGRDPLEVALEWLGLGPALVVITRGASGCVAVTSDLRVEVPAPKVEVVDTVGAGDAFMSALLAGLCDARRLGPGHVETPLTTPVLEGLLLRAVEAAAITCTRPGADPPTKAELATFSRS